MVVNGSYTAWRLVSLGGKLGSLIDVCMMWVICFMTWVGSSLHAINSPLRGRSGFSLCGSYIRPRTNPVDQSTTPRRISRKIGGRGRCGGRSSHIALFFACVSFPLIGKGLSVPYRSLERCETKKTSQRTRSVRKTCPCQPYGTHEQIRRSASFTAGVCPRPRSPSDSLPRDCNGVEQQYTEHKKRTDTKQNQANTMASLGMSWQTNSAFPSATLAFK